MKKKIKYIQLSVMSGLLLFAASCDDFLDREPLDSFTNTNYWTSEANVRTYAWDFYNQFKGYGTGGNTGTYNCEYYFLQSSNSMNITDDLVASGMAFLTGINATSNDWTSNYAVIRRANIMLEQLPTVPGMTDAAYRHWEGVARFFRAFAYFRLVQRFGSVPYYDYSVNSGTDIGEIYQPSMNRNDVMDRVLDDINYAGENIYESDGTNGVTVNRYVALALKSRIAIYEGTYRKYHNLGDGSAYLRAAKDASSQIISSGRYVISPNTPQTFVAKYNSENLSSSTEMILYRQYETGILAHAVQAYTNTSSIINGLSKGCVESYVTMNGLPVSQVGGNTEYQGDRSLNDVLANRDPRLAQTVDPEGISYVGIRTTISRARSSSTGYVPNLFYNSASANLTTIGQNTIDAPIFSYAEVLLNYAEACAELGGTDMTQNDLEISVNRLRARVGLPALTYVNENTIQVNGVTINDPKRTSALEAISGVVSSLLWEIRRERRVELMAWSHGRIYDILRWHKGEYLDTTQNPDVNLGVYLGTIPTYIDENGQVQSENITLNGDGYLVIAGGVARTFTSKYYLNNIPTNEIQTYRNNGGMELPQNPDWQ